MGVVLKLPSTAGRVRLADAVRMFLSTITVANTRRGYAITLDRLRADFGATAMWPCWRRIGCRAGSCSCGVRNRRRRSTSGMTALSLACVWWREQGWLAGDPLVRLRARPVALGSQPGD